MQISDKTISALAQVVTGDKKISPYRSGSNLVDFFNQFGSADVYGQGFPSRRFYAEEKIKELNGNSKMARMICALLDERDFLETEFKVETAVDYLNEFLKYDGYIIIKNGYKYMISNIKNIPIYKEEINNQGISAELRWNNLRFRSKTEIKIAEALEERGILFFPNCKGRLGSLANRQNREPDFLICHNGKWGILYVDGQPYHPASRSAEEHEQDRLFHYHGIVWIQRFDAERCYNQSQKVVQEFLELLSKA
ncbi:hypothetical protein IQ264_09660 [Phormidium sp. LEGE 05292]|uniref:hypothetical protein n=1 Tax=[Phormidium] sp. LEGE 05292 TaxID=767427 RepID=UPI001881C0B9|nr:hypothetical protein [Phormidium sp. LEGE 05292]MBE9225687.1 hypothetical protein [Phormidium sp. LEGE 05292]